MKEIIKKVRQGLIEVDNAIHSEFNKQVDSLGSWDLLCHNVALLEAVIAKQESDSDIIDWIIENRPSFSTTLKAMYVSKTGERYQGKDLRDAVKQAIKKQNT